MQLFHRKQVPALHFVNCARLIVKLLRVAKHNLRGFISHRAVYVNRYIAGNFSFVRQLLEIIQKHLRTPNGKRRNNDIAAALCRIVNNLGQFSSFIVNFMHTVAVSGFRYDKIGALKLFRVFQNRRAGLTDITGKNNFCFFAVFLGKNFCNGRTGNVPGYFKFGLNAGNNVKFFVKTAHYKIFKRSIGFINRIKRLNEFAPCTHSLTVGKLRIRFVNMRTVRQ